MNNDVAQCDLAAAVAYINRYACEGLDLKRLVQETQRVPAAVFIRRFRGANGRTPSAAILGRQLDEARRLLVRTELSLAFIAESTGFRDVKALKRALRAADGSAATRLLARARQLREVGGEPRTATAMAQPRARRRNSARSGTPPESESAGFCCAGSGIDGAELIAGKSFSPSAVQPTSPP